MRTLFVLTLALAACNNDGADDTDLGTDTDALQDEIVVGTETVSAVFDVDIYSAYESPVLASFDTLGGRRQLDAMTIRVDHAIEATVTLQNASDVDLAEGDFRMDHYFNSLVQLGLAPEDEEDDDQGTPFFGPGGFTVTVQTALGPQGSDTDSYEGDFTDDVNAEFEYDPVDTPRFLEAMTDKGDVTIVIGGFSETFFNFNPELEGSGVLVDWQVPNLQYSGEISIEYQFSPTE